jgi:uncharacterized protein with NRDE domain
MDTIFGGGIIFGMMEGRRLSRKDKAARQVDPMCLVFIGYRIEGCAAVMIGANREESRRRPVTSPVCCRVRSLRCLLAGADHGPDGTFPEMGAWLGVNEAGIAVAVTNRRDGELAWKDQTRSRGLLAVKLLGFDDPEPASRLAQAELELGGFGGCNYLIAGAEAAFVVQAPGAARVSLARLEPGIHAMTNLDLDDPDDPRIGLVTANLDPRLFPTSAAGLCRDERIVISGADRGTVSSSLILGGETITMDHILGDPRGRDYQRYRLPDGLDH